MGVIFFILKVITFPGTLFKAFLEQLTCRVYEIPVEFSKVFQKNELCGHVEHMLAQHKGSFGICFMPHIITLFCGISFITPAAMNMVYLGKFNLFSYIFMYLGFSVLMNCFPLVEDAINMWDNLYGQGNKSKTVSKIFLAIPAAIMYAGAYIEKYFISLITCIAFIYFLPYVISLIISM